MRRPEALATVDLAETTARAITDGWLHTGDAADGDYYIVDRWKDMYISSGENGYPAEVEDVIYKPPAVAHFAAAGHKISGRALPRSPG